MRTSFPALWMEDREKPAVMKTLGPADLPQGDVLVEVSHSSLNYKDALALTGRGKILRRVPMIPGIDLAGRVVESGDSRFRAGDVVAATGHGLGELYHGGYAGMARVPASFLVPVPGRMTAKQAMAVGTAGFTAALCLRALQAYGIKPGDGDVLVTGASGGVGTIAVMLLNAAGYRAAALTGRPEYDDLLKTLGAATVVTRESIVGLTRPMEKETWAAAVDTVGSKTLASVIAATKTGGAVAACGLAGGSDLPLTVFPFILRGVALLGIDSVNASMAAHAEGWEILDRYLPLESLDKITSEVALADAPRAAVELLNQRRFGRTVITIWPEGA